MFLILYRRGIIPYYATRNIWEQMGGPKVTHKLREKKPNIKIVKITYIFLTKDFDRFVF